MSAPDPSRLSAELHALTEVAKTLATPLPLPALLRAVLEELTHVLEPAEFGVIMLWDAAAGILMTSATTCNGCSQTSSTRH